MRQSKTLKICANHLGLLLCVLFIWFFGFVVRVRVRAKFFLNLMQRSCVFLAVIATMTVQEHAGNEKSCVWHATDFADGELKDELFCIRFASIESESWPQLNYIIFEFVIGKSRFSLDATQVFFFLNCWKIQILDEFDAIYAVYNSLSSSWETILSIIWTWSCVWSECCDFFFENQYEDRDFGLLICCSKEKIGTENMISTVMSCNLLLSQLVLLWFAKDSWPKYFLFIRVVKLRWYF